MKQKNLFSIGALTLAILISAPVSVALAAEAALGLDGDLEMNLDADTSIYDDALDTDSDASLDVNLDSTTSVGFDRDSATITGSTTDVFIGGSVISVTRSDIEDGDNGDTFSRVDLVDVSTEAELRSYATGLITDDENIEEIKFEENSVEVSYKQKGEVFGFIPVMMTVDAKVGATGEVEINYPWYKFMTSTNNQNDIESDVSNETQVITEETAEAGEQLSVSAQAELASRILVALEQNLAESIEVESETATQGQVEVE